MIETLKWRMVRPHRDVWDSQYTETESWKELYQEKKEEEDLERTLYHADLWATGPKTYRR